MPLGEWWNANPADVIREASRTYGAPNVSDAYTIIGQSGSLLSLGVGFLIRFEEHGMPILTWRRKADITTRNLVSYKKIMNSSSLLQIGQCAHEFLAKDTKHGQRKEIYQTLDSLTAHLMAKIRNVKQFEATLQRLRGKDFDISEEATAIQDYIGTLENLPKAQLPDLFQKRYSCSVIMGEGLMVFQQFGEINGICFYVSSILESAGVFCGEELLKWALDPELSFILPSSTCIVKANYEVGSFALIADIKFVLWMFVIW
ncbi:uncharacterized protein LOC141671868 isoform X2 [Apium graveolens]